LTALAPGAQEPAIALPKVFRGQSFQLTVTVTDPNGKTKSYTGSKHLEYKHFGCLTVRESGWVSVVPSGRCAGPAFPELWIVLKDFKQSGRPQRVPVSGRGSVMHRLIPMALLCFFAGSVLAQPGGDDRYRLSLAISGAKGPQFLLGIIFNDPKGNPIVLSEYLFQVTDR
jgi:hypothetical protein